MTTLQSWSKKMFDNILRELDKSRKRLEALKIASPDQHEIRQATGLMNELLYKEEMMWLQRSRVTWVKEGYGNTNFFSSKSSLRSAD
jgi:hypothetical protein